jgi:hypothetical protein
MLDYQLFKNIQKHISLTDNDKDYIMSLINEKNVLKKEFILKQGQTCKKNLFC